MRAIVMLILVVMPVQRITIVNIGAKLLYFLAPSKIAIQKLEPNASTWSSLRRPEGATKRLGQLSRYSVPTAVRKR